MIAITIGKLMKRRFECTECDYTVRLKETLKVYIGVHTDKTFEFMKYCLYNMKIIYTINVNHILLHSLTCVSLNDGWHCYVLEVMCEFYQSVYITLTVVLFHFLFILWYIFYIYAKYDVYGIECHPRMYLDPSHVELNIYHSCPKCDNKCHIESFYYEHMVKHTGEGTFECSECG